MTDSSNKTGVTVEGGTLQDRLRLLEEQKQRDAAQALTKKTDKAHASGGASSKDLVQDRLKWVVQQGKVQTAQGNKTTEIRTGSLAVRLKLLDEQRRRERLGVGIHKEKVLIEGGGLKDRLALLEKEVQREQARIKQAKDLANANIASQATGGGLQERLKLLEEEKERILQKLEKNGVTVEGGNLQDRLQMLEQEVERERQRLAQAGNHEAVQVDASMEQRLQLLQEERQRLYDKLQQHSQVVVEGGGLADRLQALDQEMQKERQKMEQEHVDGPNLSERMRLLEAEKQRVLQSVDKREIVVQGGALQDRLQALDQELQKTRQHLDKNNDEQQQVEGGGLAERMKQLDEERQRLLLKMEHQKKLELDVGINLDDRKRILEQQAKQDAERLTLYANRMMDMSTSQTIQDRMQWISRSQGDDDSSSKAHVLISNDLVAERMQWLQESAEKAAQLPEKERVEIAKNIVAQRKAWLDEQKVKAAQLPPRERIEVTHGLIAERMAWFMALKSKAQELSHEQRTTLTTGLIAERLAALDQQMEFVQEDEEAKASLEQQIVFLEEQQTNALAMTDDEQLMMANLLIEEKMNDLEAQKDIIVHVSEEDQIEVVHALIEDRQTWLEGGDDYMLLRENKKREQQEAAAMGQSTTQLEKELEEMARQAITYWTEQKNNVPNMSEEERIQTTSTLIVEHIAGLEQQLNDPSTDEETKESVHQQVAFLMEQIENIETVDHVVMIDALVTEKLAILEQQLSESTYYA